ncbi:MAG: carbamoyltransferase HypF, partial [bacterium]|nr:carbamoyltransferase HypF [bacterium]
GFERVAHLREFRLPGGEAAIREAWRSAASLRHEVGLPAEGPPQIQRMLERDVNCPVTTSVGRLFDAVAAITGVARENRFEGQAAMELETAIGRQATSNAYPLPGGDWRELIGAVCADSASGVPAPEISVRFHNALAHWILDEARRAGAKDIIMSGGVFQNRYLTEQAAALLEAEGFRVHTHQRVPANDGGIALGQAVLASRS